jgi:hypothetical protein
MEQEIENLSERAFSAEILLFFGPSKHMVK